MHKILPTIPECWWLTDCVNVPVLLFPWLERELCWDRLVSVSVIEAFPALGALPGTK